jgi:hypothetical protein
MGGRWEEDGRKMGGRWEEDGKGTSNSYLYLRGARLVCNLQLVMSFLI